MKTAESAIKELISRIENAKVESRNPNNRTKRTGEYRIGLSQAINLAHDVIAELAEELASHPCPVEYPEAIIANFQPTSPMSAEQVEELGYYYPLFKFFADEHGLTLLDSQMQDVIHECKKFIEPATTGENWKAEYDNCRALLQELVSLKVMKENLYKGNPDGKEYAERKPKAWQAAQQFLSTYQHEGLSTTPSVKADVVKTPHPDKPFIVANVREIIEGFEMRGDYSYSRMTEMFNDAAFQWMAKHESVKAEGWVSVEDGLPTEKDADENGKVLICRNMNEGQKSMSKTIFDWSMVKNCDKTTMWQPLPAPPKQKL